MLTTTWTGADQRHHAAVFVIAPATTPHPPRGRELLLGTRARPASTQCTSRKASTTPSTPGSSTHHRRPERRQRGRTTARISDRPAVYTWSRTNPRVRPYEFPQCPPTSATRGCSAGFSAVPTARCGRAPRPRPSVHASSPAMTRRSGANDQISARPVPGGSHPLHDAGQEGPRQAASVAAADTTGPAVPPAAIKMAKAVVSRHRDDRCSAWRAHRPLWRASDDAGVVGFLRQGHRLSGIISDYAGDNGHPASPPLPATNVRTRCGPPH